MRYIPSQADCNIIKAAAAKESGMRVGCVSLQPGCRSGPKGHDLNVLLVTDDPKWNDTDLYDYGDWPEFRKGVELTESGDATVDFYIRNRFDEWKELHGNVVAEIKAGKLVRVYGFPGEHYNAEVK